ncbi:MAG: hypothetical protein JWO32_379, partial [Bacteroidetes bacterium]|nr:hypothetical protein [Bacteroidota bacterium]
NYTNTVVTPEIVSITLPNDKVDNINAIVTSYAISMIANGKSYQQALSKLSNDAPEITKEKLKQVYLQLIQRADASAITAVEKETAKQIIAQVGTP